MDLNVIGKAEDAIAALCDQVRGRTLPHIEQVIATVRQVAMAARDDTLPSAQRALLDVADVVGEAKGALDQAQATLADAQQLLQRISAGCWLDAHVETEQGGAYHIRLRVEPEEGTQR